MTSPIVINIPGAKLLSKELSKNARIHQMKKARIVRRHRGGANNAVSKAIARLPGYSLWLVGEYGFSLPRFVVYPRLNVRSVTLTRFCPGRYIADGDNGSTVLSATRDGVADALGVNDKVFVDNPTEEQLKAGQIGIRYEQIAGDWGVRITIEPR